MTWPQPYEIKEIQKIRQEQEQPGSKRKMNILLLQEVSSPAENTMIWIIRESFSVWEVATFFSFWTESWAPLMHLHQSIVEDDG